MRLQQVVANLLDNAVKFSPAESRILLTAWLEEGQVYLEVTDSGPGIDPACLARVFEPFWQADASSRRRYGGAGLGLAIAREIALLHEGDLRAANAKPGTGRCFTFRFPLVPAARGPSEPKACRRRFACESCSSMIRSIPFRCSVGCSPPRACTSARRPASASP